MSEPRGEAPAHGTGYEDAIARRIAALEGAAKETTDRLGRATATVEELTRDNATLRVRAGEAEARARRAGGLVVVCALVALLILGAAAWLLTRPRA
jgi:hypothetical protein